MFNYAVGDILKSDTQALVNTVNCEGFMGKGIAYQFKLKYPENNVDYIKACKDGTLRIGTLHYFEEDGKLIINFPTKDKWRELSKLEYIEKGLVSLNKLIRKLHIESISIPPLGSGNGGLNWSDVQPLIEKHLEDISLDCDIVIYEPSHGYNSIPKQEPNLSTSALVLMRIKDELNSFSAFRLQKTAYFMNLFANENYFKFTKYKRGPYDNSIAIVSRRIKEFQQYHDVNTQIAFEIAMTKLVSDSVKQTLKRLDPYIMQAAAFVNTVPNDYILECYSTVLFILQETGPQTVDGLVAEFTRWSDDKARRFSKERISESVKSLYTMGFIQETLMGYSVCA